MPLENEGTCRAVKQYRPSRGIRCSWKRARGYISDTSYREGELADLSHPVTSFARSREGVDFDSRDGQPTHLFFLLAVPEHSEGQHLKALARISRFLHDASFRGRLWKAETREEVCRAVQQEDAKF